MARCRHRSEGSQGSPMQMRRHFCPCGAALDIGIAVEVREWVGHPQHIHVGEEHGATDRQEVDQHLHVHVHASCSCSCGCVSVWVGVQ